MKISDTVYYFDQNARTYDDKGNKVYRKHFRTVKITGESRTHWQTEYAGKFHKNPLPSTRYPQTWNSKVQRLFTKDDVEEAVYVHDNRLSISNWVRDHADAETLKAIEKLLQGKEGTP